MGSDSSLCPASLNKVDHTAREELKVTQRWVVVWASPSLMEGVFSSPHGR